MITNGLRTAICKSILHLFLNYLEIQDGEKRLALSHYLMLSWGGAARGALHIYAHIHNKKDGLVYETLKQMDNALNAGVEINNYRPVTLSELILNNRRFMDGL